ncbi:MAG: hypothetical protein JO162_08815 [Alphaproteobacteria bacterium]|nr:hypothetical protein [Alphaproteobacteria bacterium]
MAAPGLITLLRCRAVPASVQTPPPPASSGAASARRNRRIPRRRSAGSYDAARDRDAPA